MFPERNPALRYFGFLTCVAAACLSSRARAHGISEESRETMADGGILEYIWLGAEHMVTGYDHLLFLFGVIFFLTGFRDIVRFITAFTLGHCITLLGATLAGITANAYLIDAVIALSVVYKGFENLDGFKKVLDIKAPNLLNMVFAFGLVHGFGLSTRLQELPLGDDGLVLRILAFNVGVELGQIAALAVMLVGFSAWRARPSFERFANSSNSALVLAGVGLFFFQMNGYFTDAHHRVEAAADEHHDDHGHAHEGEGHAHDGEHGHAHAAEKPAEHGHAHEGEAHAHGEEEAAEHEHGEHGHAHEAEKPAEHGHAHAHAAEKPAEHGHAHGEHGHAHEAEKPSEHGHAHGEHGHAHEAKPKPKEAEKPKGHDHGEHGHDHGEAHHH